MTILGQGCLVTEAIDFPTEEPVPPTIIDSKGSQLKIGHIARYSRNSTGAAEITLQATVRDPNIDETLFARLRAVSKLLDTPQMLTSCDGETGDDVTVVAATGTSERMLSIPVARTEFSEPGCYRLELAVSGSFKNTCAEVTLAPSVFTATSISGDYGLSKWWVLVTDGPVSDDAIDEATSGCLVDDFD